MTRRKAAFTAIADDDDEDIPVSYCPSCKDYGFNRLMGERVYPNGEPKPSDHDSWLCCHSCGLLLPKYQAKRLDEITGIKEPDNNPHDYPGKLAIATTHKHSSSHAKSREILNFIKKTRPGASRSKDYVDVDLDLRSHLNSGKQLVNYSSTNDEFEG
jgi:hypothetical protein